MTFKEQHGKLPAFPIRPGGWRADVADGTERCSLGSDTCISTSNDASVESSIQMSVSFQSGDHSVEKHKKQF